MHNIPNSIRSSYSEEDTKILQNIIQFSLIQNMLSDEKLEQIENCINSWPKTPS